MAPSQLSQLKSALQGAGLSRQSQGKKGKKNSKAGLTNKDREKKQQKLDEIRSNLNKFDVREQKTKNPVVGHGVKKVAKGVVGTPSLSRQRGLEMRRETLLPEQSLRRAGHTGQFIDRRFGEDNPHITPEERALERFTRAREIERNAGGKPGRKAIFNLNDDEDGIGGGLGFGDDDLGGGQLGAVKLTHGGREINDLRGDDFSMQGLMDDDDDEIEDNFGINATSGQDGEEAYARRAAMGAYGEDENNDPDRVKTKAEVMAEVIAKSKLYKHERQKQKELDDDMRMELDEGLEELRGLLDPTSALPSSSVFSKTAPAAEAEEEVAKDESEALKPAEHEPDYDQYVRSLAFDRRAKPKDRTKTEEETIKEEAEKLEAAEKARLRRMRGEESEDDDEPSRDGPISRRKRRAKGKGKDDDEERLPNRVAGGDDLDDDFYDDGVDAAEAYGLGQGIQGAGSDEESEMDDEDEDEDGEGSEDDDEDSGSEEEEDLEDLESEDDADIDDDDDQSLVKAPRKWKMATNGTGKKEIPFTFPCPTTHDDLLDIMNGLEDKDIEVVVKRIRTLYHPSRGEGNKERLQDLLGILIDHILYLTSDPSSMTIVSGLLPHLTALVQLNPLTAAEHFKAKLDIMQKNLAKGLAKGATLPQSRTFPGSAELTFLRIVGLVWSTSDFSHPIGAPAELLIGQYLSQARVRSLKDMASGLFLCSIFLQFEAYSKRIIPEVLNFFATTFMILGPLSMKVSPLPGSFPLGDMLEPSGKERLSGLKLRSKLAAGAAVQKPNFPDLLKLETEEVQADEEQMEQGKVDLLAVAIRLVMTSAEMYSEVEAFVEVFQPLLELMKALQASKIPKELKSLCTEQIDGLTRMIKFAMQARQPLSMQTFKPIPIPSYTPKFDLHFSAASRKHQDPDAERNEANKVKALYKKERKGAIRELRKDNKFLAVERAKEQKAKDEAYEKKMRQVHGSIATTERAEEKAMERDKARDKRRSGRK
ncbi:hypothetical protein QFC24_004798 [Naganishia onofrii]|uniref:Uncharacterized protein n=1 Tax=Naganishia onofrii TaxID=1851511 RepID=A0ACC2XCN6_9TREE|nr:hypothetical protein QFC24_004798 [Naganishia onofrii]